jgi:hypothetical protein
METDIREEIHKIENQEIETEQQLRERREKCAREQENAKKTVSQLFPQDDFDFIPKIITFCGKPVKHNMILEGKTHVFAIESYICIATLEQGTFNDDSCIKIHVNDLDAVLYAVQKSFSFLEGEEETLKMIISKLESTVILWELSACRGVVIVKTLNEADHHQK